MTLLLFAKIHSIGGVVRSAASGDPIAGAAVGLADANRGRDQKTGADGQYRLDGLAEGTYRIRAAASGFTTKFGRVDVPNLQQDEYDLELS